jgi:hypothetical protein
LLTESRQIEVDTKLFGPAHKVSLSHFRLQKVLQDDPLKTDQRGLDPTHMRTRSAIRLCRLLSSTATATIKLPTNNITESYEMNKDKPFYEMLLKFDEVAQAQPTLK